MCTCIQNLWCISIKIFLQLIQKIKNYIKIIQSYQLDRIILTKIDASFQLNPHLSLPEPNPRHNFLTLNQNTNQIIENSIQLNKNSLQNSPVTFPDIPALNLMLHHIETIEFIQSIRNY